MADDMFLVVTATVLLSIFAHGGVPASRRFGEWFSKHSSGHMAEAAAVEDMPTRRDFL